MEVFPRAAESKMTVGSLLHVRGGVSRIVFHRERIRRSSPRPWRCFCQRFRCAFSRCVFSTSVEVFPRKETKRRRHECLLHVRGGVSTTSRRYACWRPSSPRPWRCFSKRPTSRPEPTVFSTSVEVFLWIAHLVEEQQSLLHVRGGVSIAFGAVLAVITSSPRPWRCFLYPHNFLFERYVFSTSVEVFLWTVCFRTAVCSSSPRPWRCFHRP